MNDKSGESIQPMEEVPRKEGKMPDIREKCRKNKLGLDLQNILRFIIRLS